jgi:2-iminoacetate synthase
MNTSGITYPEIVNEPVITELLKKSRVFDAARFQAVLQKAAEAKGLSHEDCAFLLSIQDPERIAELTECAVRIKEEIYGRRMVLFAPLYTSSFCSNDCLYCGFRANSHSQRRRLSLDEIKEEVKAIVGMGHKRILMVAGEDASLTSEQIRDQILAIYSVREPRGNIRRVNLNVAPLEIDDFRVIKCSGIGTYQCFQETYHRETYTRMHVKGRKTDYDYRIHVFDRCIKAGIDDFGAGFLFGLYDYRFEVLALLQHVAFLEKNFGVGPHTISIPRLEPAEGTDLFEKTPWRVTDEDIIKATAILRLAVPYTGIILSTRESPAMRKRLLQVGVSQMSAGSVTNPGGYSEKQEFSSQFSVQDHRSLDEVIREACSSGYIPSFCTGCYRKGRTGEAFQAMAKDHHISPYCNINAVVTLLEYLEDFATPETKKVGEECIRTFLKDSKDEKVIQLAEERLKRIKSGDRDLLY